MFPSGHRPPLPSFSARPPPRPSFDAVSIAAVRNLGDRRDGSAANPFLGENYGDGLRTATLSSLVAAHSDVPAAAGSSVNVAAAPSFVMVENVTANPSPTNATAGSNPTGRRSLPPESAMRAFATGNPNATPTFHKNSLAEGNPSANPNSRNTPHIESDLSVEGLAAQIRDLRAQLDGRRSARRSRSRGRSFNSPPLRGGELQGPPNPSPTTTWSKIV